MNNIKISRIQRKSAEDVLEWLLRYGRDWVSYDELYNSDYLQAIKDKELGISEMMAMAMGMYAGKAVTLQRHGYIEEDRNQDERRWNISRRYRLTPKAILLLEKYNKYNELKGKEHGRRKETTRAN